MVLELLVAALAVFAIATLVANYVERRQDVLWRLRKRERKRKR